MDLTTENVNKVTDECAGIGPDSFEVEGIVRSFRFSKAALDRHREDIIDMLHHLPHQFRRDDGGGWSFLMACDREDGTRWTDIHRVMEQLLALGLGVGAATLTLPRDLWGALPGSVPYFTVESRRSTE